MAALDAQSGAEERVEAGHIGDAADSCLELIDGFVVPPQF
jgi:hypothetical protein